MIEDQQEDVFVLSNKVEKQNKNSTQGKTISPSKVFRKFVTKIQMKQQWLS